MSLGRVWTIGLFVAWACCPVGSILRNRVAHGAPPAIVAEPEANVFTDVHGGEYRLPGRDDCRAVVLVFFGHDCPISNGYAPELSRIEQEYSPQGVAFCLVYADADLTQEDARRHAEEYGFSFPAILDPQMKLALQVGATIKPEAAVLSPQGELLYRGRIDDLYADFGKRRSRPTQRNLRDAIEAVLAGKPVAVPRTTALGCDIDLPEQKNE